MKQDKLARVRNAALAPYGVWALVFIVVPLFFVAYYAFTDASFHFTTDNMTRFFTARSNVGGREVYTYLLIFARSLKLVKHILAHPELLDRPLGEPSGFDYK